MTQVLGAGRLSPTNGVADYRASHQDRAPTTRRNFCHAFNNTMLQPGVPTVCL